MTVARDRTIAREEIALAANVKTALVTGAGSGIGQSIARTLAKMGLRLALVGRDRGDSTNRADIVAGGDSALVVPCDITDRFAVKSLVEQVTAALGPIDVLVCNAGTNVRNRSLESLDPADWDQNDRDQLDRLVQPRPLCPPRRCGGGGVGWSSRSARCRAYGPAPSARRGLLGLEVRPVGSGHLPRSRGRA